MTLHQQFQHAYVLLDDGDRRALRAIGLTPTQFHLLRQLTHQPAYTYTITHLSQLLLCTRGNVTRLVRRMEQQDLVQIGSDQHDQRLVKVALTERGTALLDQARSAYNAAIQRRLGGLDHAAQATLHDLMQRVVTLLADDLAVQPQVQPEDDEFAP